MTTIKQIKAARALLEWTQDELAKKSGLSRLAINNLERGIASPRADTIQAIEKALSDAGIEFTEGTGVRLKGEILKVQVFEGIESIFRLYNDIFDTLKDEDNPEFLVSGVNEKQFVEVGGERFLKIIEKFGKYKISSRLLVLEGDSYFIDPVHYYRWAPEALFNLVPYFVYEDKYAILIWQPTPRVVLIENKPVADSYRKQFNAVWKMAKLPKVN